MHSGSSMSNSGVFDDEVMKSMQDIQNTLNSIGCSVQPPKAAEEPSIRQEVSGTSTTGWGETPAPCQFNSNGIFELCKDTSQDDSTNIFKDLPSFPDIQEVSENKEISADV